MVTITAPCLLPTFAVITSTYHLLTQLQSLLLVTINAFYKLYSLPLPLLAFLTTTKLFEINSFCPTMLRFAALLSRHTTGNMLLGNQIGTAFATIPIFIHGSKV